jgi:hypothetical protein
LLYLDDGETFNHNTKNESALIKYGFTNNKLYYNYANPTYSYDIPTTLFIREIYIHGISKNIKSITML